MPSIEVPGGAPWDWITWAIQGAIAFCLGWLLKLHRDVESLKLTRAKNEDAIALIPQMSEDIAFMRGRWRTKRSYDQHKHDREDDTE